MNSKIKTGISIFLLILCSGAAMYSEEKILLPKKNQVVIIGRCVLGTQLNDDFYAKTFNLAPEDILPHRVKLEDDELMAKNTATSADLNEYFFVTYDLKRDRTISIPFFRLYLFNYDIANLILPLSVSVTVPEGQNYLYIGTFIYEFEEGNTFTIKSISVEDEFDDASAILNKKLGKNVQLYRAVLKDMKTE